MTTINFTIPKNIFSDLAARFPNLGKNIDVGKFAVEIVRYYFYSIDSKSRFVLDIGGVYIAVASKCKLCGSAREKLLSVQPYERRNTYVLCYVFCAECSQYTGTFQGDGALRFT